MALADDADNFQFPDDPGALCTPASHVIDPMLGALATRSGPVGDYVVASPLAGSAVIGAATNCPSIDLIGNPRPVMDCKIS